MPTIAVFGATGAQGGSVVNRLLENPQWKVRGITRDIASPKARALSARGVEMVSADVNSVSSITSAIAGAEAVFGITFWWDLAFATDYASAGPAEVAQLLNIAAAASRSPSLRHLVLSVLPSGGISSGGKFSVPHFDHKQTAIAKLRAEMPALAAITTEFWAGFYPANFVTLPQLRFIPVPSAESGARVLIGPSLPEGELAMVGDVATNPGIIVEAILEAGSKTFERTVVGVTENVSWAGVAAAYERVTGRPAAYVQVPAETFAKVYGDFGAEFVMQTSWSEEYPDWNVMAGDRRLSLEELGIRDKLVGFDDTMQSEIECPIQVAENEFVQAHARDVGGNQAHRQAAGRTKTEHPISITSVPGEMEALAAVSLAGNVLQFAHTTRKLISNYRDLSGLGTNEEHVELAAIVSKLQSLVARIVPPVAHNRMSKEDQSLRDLCNQCHNVADRLLGILKRLADKGDQKPFGSVYQALATEWKAPEIEELWRRLDRIIAAIKMHLELNQRPVMRRLEELEREGEWLCVHRDADFKTLRKDVAAFSEDKQAELLIAAAAKGSQFAAEQAILEYLRFPSINHRHDTIAEAHGESFTWLFGSGDQESPSTFSDWLTCDDDSDIYWISGKPGSGKSTLMKFLSSHAVTNQKLHEWASSRRRSGDPTPGTVVRLVRAEFFFWVADGDRMQKSHEGLLRSLLYQILRQCPDLISKVYYSAWCAGLPSDYEAGLAAERAGIDFCFFIDGLDEFEGHPRDMIQLIRDLRTLPNLKLCVASREWNEFEDEFGQEKTRKLYMQDYNSSDIKAYVYGSLLQDKNYQELEDKSMGEELSKEIVTAANGVFLWVFLVVRSFREGLSNGDSIGDLRRRLRELPTDLNQYFERIVLSDVSEFYRGYSAEMFSVALAAPEPLPLMTYWFMGEGRDDPQYTQKMEIRPLSVPQINKRLKDAKRRLKACCKGLLEPHCSHIYSSAHALPSSAFFSWTVSFLHRTVKEFFALDHIDDLLQRRCQPGWSADVTIGRALLAQAKTAPSDPEYWRPGHTCTQVEELAMLSEQCCGSWLFMMDEYGALGEDIRTIMAKRKTNYAEVNGEDIRTVIAERKAKYAEIHQACAAGNQPRSTTATDDIVTDGLQATIRTACPVQPVIHPVQPAVRPIHIPENPNRRSTSRFMRRLFAMK
ncbi:hypothetical protein QBC47DRAFT_445306 [Echria macrotheca]|uniref:NmrA-like domain-containing protein n=1 Tax=Echria macrotheca TaxID=438768 RepID=A0AAJ0BE44_9PEZI|nr:hypothetical protein QBC47DRAFT_445306 [Echria macrotheca]